MPVDEEEEARARAYRERAERTHRLKPQLPGDTPRRRDLDKRWAPLTEQPADKDPALD